MERGKGLQVVIQRSTHFGCQVLYKTLTCLLGWTRTTLTSSYIIHWHESSVA